MTDHPKPFSVDFVAAQIAGSIRLSGGNVTSEQLHQIKAILRGEISAADVVAEIVTRHSVNKSNNDELISTDICQK